MIHEWIRSKFFFLRSILIISSCCLLFSPRLCAEYANNENPQSENFQNDEIPATINLFAEDISIQPGRPFWVILQMDLKKGWHSYWKNPGDSGMPMQIGWNLPEGITVEDIQWPTPKRFDQSGLIGYGYEEKATFLVRLRPSDKLSPALKNVKIDTEVRWLACSDAFCTPGSNELSLELPVLISDPVPNAQNIKLFAETRIELPKTQWDIHVSQANNLIEIALTSPNDSLPTFKNAYFIPETKGNIDSSIEASLVVDPQKMGHYVVVIKELPASKLAILKGILVLVSETEQGVFTVAIEINTPIKNAKSDIAIGDADIKVLKNHRAENLQTPEVSNDDREFQGGIVLALFFAFIGGLILNLMPCVFPVISFKILSFVKMSGASRRTTLLHGIAFAVGVLVSFWIFAGLLLMLKAYGLEAGWGFQLQQPLFVAFLASLLLVFALSLFGVFEFGVSMSALAGDAEQKVGGNSTALIGSFFSGMLATALATPCTGPFMAPALGFAATLPAFWSMTIFTSLGLGMAFPYLLLSAYPSLLRFLPRPGAWMTTFKELMGFMMLITVLWLISVFAAETGLFSLLLLLSGFLILAMASWIYGRCCLPSATKLKRYMGVALSGVFALIAGYIINASATTPMVETHESGQGEWENFSAARLKQLRDEGKPVFIDFTAKWCLICQANHLVLSTDEVSQKLKSSNVIKMKADWTSSDPEITSLLREFGRNGVPLYVLYGKDTVEAPQVLPQLLTPGSIIEAIENI